MPSDFIEFPRDPHTKSASSRGIRPPENLAPADVLDGRETSPPPGLMKKRRHFSFWLLIALLLGGLIALLLVAISSD